MKCGKCGKDFNNIRKLTFHLECFHNYRNQFSYGCPEVSCKRSFHQKHSFKQHLYKVHFSKSSTSTSVHNNLIPETDIHKDVNMNNNSSDNNIVSGESEGEINNEHTNRDCKTILRIYFEEFQQKLSTAVSVYISQLYDNILIPRNLIQSIIQYTVDFLYSGIFEILKNSVFLLLKLDTNLDYEMLQIIENLFLTLTNCFKNVDTEYKRFNLFQNSSCLVMPEKYRIGESTDTSCRKGTVALVVKERYGYYIPLAKTLYAFLKLPNVLNEILNYQDLVSKNVKNCLFNVLNGSLWRSLTEHLKNKLTLPLILYFDDFETGNPLGSHAGMYKMGAVYFSILTIPPKYSSLLENIFLAQLFHSSDRTTFGNKAVFDILVEQLNDLEINGLLLETSQNEVCRIHFKVVIITGDNLGIHSIFGLNESFSSIHYCRFCLCSKDEMQKQTEEDLNKLRQVNDYETHLNCHTFGVKDQCVFHYLNNFHIYNNIICDVMHDLYEGVHRYVMAKIINALILKKYFCLETLNSRIKFFKYDYFEKNIPPAVSKDSLKNGCIICSAIEMLTLVRNFRFYVGDLVEENDEIWCLYLLLLQITEILDSLSISDEVIQLLHTLIEEHHKLYINLFNDNLKPKFHFLLHYARIIKKIGPPHLFSCMRYEAKHKEAKSYSCNVRCRKNLPYTIALKMQLKFCYRIMSQKGFSDDIRIGSVEYVDKNNFNFSNSSVNLKNYVCVSYFEINSLKYMSGQAVLSSISVDELPQFCKIVYVFVNEQNDCLLFCNSLETIHFDLHTRTYIVNSTDEVKYIFLKDLEHDSPSSLITLPNGKLVISKMY